jgi:hypothetical protein
MKIKKMMMMRLMMMMVMMILMMGMILLMMMVIKLPKSTPRKAYKSLCYVNQKITIIITMIENKR